MASLMQTLDALFWLVFFSIDLGPQIFSRIPKALEKDKVNKIHALNDLILSLFTGKIPVIRHHILVSAQVTVCIAFSGGVRIDCEQHSLGKTERKEQECPCPHRLSRSSFR